MDAVLISTKGQIVLPVAVRRALGLKPGMRVHVQVDGRKATVTPVAPAPTSSLKDIQDLLHYDGPSVPIEAMRVTDYRD
jgi:AbrB family looped-hinge helix DNA binding protein